MSYADAEQIAVCQNRQWIYVTMDKVAAGLASHHDVTNVDLYTLLKALQQSQILDDESLRQLILRMENTDRTRFLFSDDLFAE